MQLSPLIFALIVKSWCLSDREFPKFFKTPLTFNPGLNLKAVTANKTQATSFALVGCKCKRPIWILSLFPSEIPRLDSQVFTGFTESRYILC